ncbi:hypothetical protein [Sphingomonas sp.]|uniref:hypothetical protein n=1 Tax=Sphingomonas sp. TaxID=28214 RepID=UPI003AFFC889
MRGLVIAALIVASPAAAQVAGPSVTRPPAGQAQGTVPQRAPIGGVLVLYGNERCPTDREGNEVIVCEYRSASEQFRVPKELREFVVTPENQSWARQAQGTLAAGEGVNSIGSCSAVGPGGQTGCFIQQSRNNRATNQARAAQERAVP